MSKPQKKGFYPIPKITGGGALGVFAITVTICCGLLLLFSTTAWADDCPDNDGDGFVVCNDCTVPEGKQCGDCDDDRKDINPAAEEFCGDLVDNNCDGNIDFNAGEKCTIGFPDGCLAPSPEQPCCLTESVLVCTDDGKGVVCETPGTGVDEPEAELAYNLECHDDLDNDCDSLVDGDDPDCLAVEQCNTLDDDYDGDIDEDFNLGDPCTVGVGACARDGVLICDKPTTTRCSASPGNPKDEDTPGSGRCVDDIDNDCDGLVDIEDPGCQGIEECDGIDNDGDGLIDEDFAGLGDECVSGLGQCQNEGTVVCSPDGKTTICNAVPDNADPEGPTGATCSDGIDNDCDGLVDAEDLDCSSADFAVSCALPYFERNWRPGFNSCVGLHRVLFFTNVDLEENPDVDLTAELMAVTEEGEVLASIPVENGDLARLASRIDPEDWEVRPKGDGENHKVFAPVPLLRVTLEDGKNKEQAFCSNIPWLHVLEPKGTVVTESEGDTTRVLVAMPLVNPGTISVKVDGVQIFNSLGIANPASCTPGSPCAGMVNINERQVQITDLAVQSSPVWWPARNTLEMRVSNLGCGQHIFVVEGIRRLFSFPFNPDEQCLTDDILDKGDSSGLSITIDSPEEFEVLVSAPIEVQGLACSGREISEVEINGKNVSVDDQTFESGDGENSGDKYELPIDIPVGETDLADDLISGDKPLGTFDQGSNRLIASVTDDLGNRSFDSTVFALGDVASPGIEEKLKASIQEDLRRHILAATERAASEIDNAFIVGMSKQAVQKLFDERCRSAGQQFAANLQNNIINQVVDSRKVNVTACSCDPTVTTRITGFSLDVNTISCPVTFAQDKISVRMNLPDISVSLGVYGSCRIEDPIFGACIAKTTVSGSTSANLTGARVDFDITEKQLLKIDPPAPALFTPPVASEPPTGGISISIGCLASVCDFFLTPFAAIVNAIANDRLIPVLGFGVTLDVNFEVELGSSQPDPIELGEIKVDEEEVEEFGQKLEGLLSDVQINTAGLTAGLVGRFETTSVDPDAEPTPGAVLTPAPLPNAPVANSDDVVVALADDTFNQLFASLAISGKLKTGCNDTGLTVGDLLPLDCEDISVGQCSNDDSISCKTDTDCGGGGPCEENALKTAIARGACHAFKGDDCEALPLGQRLVCRATADKLAQINISASQPLLLCARQDVPPRLLIQDDGTTPAVENALRLNDLSVALIVDRDGNGQLDGELTATFKCLAEGAPTIGDCSFFGACLDLNIETAMQLASKSCEGDPSIICTDNADCASVGGACVDVCDSGKPGFVTRVLAIQPTIRTAGVVCGGATTPGDDDLLADASGEDQTIDILLENATRFSPPACIEGLSLGGFVEFKNPRLIAIDVDGDPTFDDYIGITGDIE